MSKATEISIGFSSTETLVKFCNENQMEFDQKIKEEVKKMGNPTEVYKSFLSFL